VTSVTLRKLAIPLILSLVPAGALRAQEDRYRTRPSDFRYGAPPGRPLRVRTSDTGIRIRGYVAGRVRTYTAGAAGLDGGELVVGSEYGRVEIAESDDDQVRLQVRWEAFGEGAAHPGEAARRAIEETAVRVHMTAHQGRLMVRVWHPTLGFTVPGAQPAWFGVRLQVPARGAYRVSVEAFHGIVAIRRLTLSRGAIRGRAGEKLKGIGGYIGGTELYDVTLAGDVDIANPTTPHGAPITARVRVASTCRLTASTAGDINIAVQPDPVLGVRAWAGANNGPARVAIDRGVKRDGAGGTFRNQEQVESAGYDRKPIRLEVRAASEHGKVNVASIPAAPLPEDQPAAAP